VNFNFNYIGESSIDVQFLSEFGLSRDSVTIGSKLYTDMQLTYNYRKAQFYFGVDNLFGTKPPQFDTNGLIPVSVENTSTGSATDAGVYDAIGRRYYVGVRMAL
jgi:outer membrane receptor protein involved in Fe transport